MARFEWPNSTPTSSKGTGSPVSSKQGSPVWTNQGVTHGGRRGAEERKSAFPLSSAPHVSPPDSSKQGSPVWMKQGIRTLFQDIQAEGEGGVGTILSVTFSPGSLVVI
ncbi:hypothetical protein AAC387_Pa06g0203 [Persea americana]